MNSIPTVNLAEEINLGRAMIRRAEQIGVKEAAQIYGVHRSTLWRLRKRSVEGAPVFDRRHLNPGAASGVDETRVQWALGFMAQRQRVPLARVCKELNKVALRESWPQTNYYALRRAIEKLPDDVRLILTEGGKAVYEKASIVGKRVSSRPLELLQLDATEMPVWTVHPVTGELVTGWMSGVIDSFSRVIMGLEFHLAPPDAIAAAVGLTNAFLPKYDARWPFFGIAETVQTDNAKIYIGNLLARVAVRAGFILDSIPNGCPGANGKIERFFETFENYFFSKMPGYSAQTSGKGKAESRGVVPWEILQSQAKRALYEYHTTVHSELGITPWESWHENIQHSHNYGMAPAVIRDLMRIEIDAEVTREGVIVLGTKYSGECLSKYVGSKISVLTSAAGGDRSVDAYRFGLHIGKLRPAQFVASAINKARLEQKLTLTGFRKKVGKALESCPPVDEPTTVIPKEERKRIRAAQNKPARRGKIHPVKLEIESDERKS